MGAIRCVRRNGSCADDAAKSCECLDGSKVLYAAGRIVPFSGRGATFAPKTVEDLGDARQALVVCRNGEAGPDAGRRFAAFVNSTGGRTLMQKDGVLLPAESRPPPEPAEARP